MPSVNDVVRSSIYNYPALYAHRTDVLAALLVGYGNGYAWDTNGELVNIFDDGTDQTDDEVIYKTHEWTLSHLSSENPLARHMAEEQVADDNARNAIILERRRHADTLALTPGPLTDPARKFEPGYSLMDIAPDNITDDWAAAIAETRSVMEPLWYTGAHLVPPQVEVVRTPEEQTEWDTKMALAMKILTD